MTYPKIDTIPDCLCTRAEAAAILGITRSKNTMSTYHKRGLRYTTVRLKAYGRVALYNREEVKTYAPIPIPPDRILLKDLISLVAQKTNHTFTASRANGLLRHHNCNPSPLSPKHAALTWPKEAALAILTTIAASKNKKAN